jgi:hypothetical protein
MTTDSQIGRVLTATLHQAIVELLPTRLEFYENWLHGVRLRDGTIGLAAITAVVGFLRTEGAPYHAVMATAGRYTADWTIDAMPALRRRWISALPRRLRTRAALRAVRAMVRAAYAPSRVVAQTHRGQIRVEVQDSLFCKVREPHDSAQCDYYLALVTRALQRFGLLAESQIDICVAAGATGCVMTLTLTV